jgi:spectinomycin phosphotransferase
MEERPAGVTDDQVVEALRGGWDFDATVLEYAALGFGSYHWTASNVAGDRRFVTVDDLDNVKPTREAAFESLARAFSTAQRLRDDGFEFVVAPIRSNTGEVVRHLSARHAIAVFPFSTGRAGEWGEVMTAVDRGALIDILAELHRATASAHAAAPQLGFEPILRSQQRIEAALRETDQPWTEGPFSEPVRKWFLDRERDLRILLDRVRQLMSEISTHPDDLAVTHGEPHPGNVMRTDEGLVLIDWDTVGLTRPERDLWWFADDAGALARYAEKAGRVADPKAITLYRDAWIVSDLESMLHVFRSAHVEDDDTRHEWRALKGLAWDGVPGGSGPSA